MEKLKRYMSLFLAVLIVFTIMPVTAFADDKPTQGYDYSMGYDTNADTDDGKTVTIEYYTSKKVGQSKDEQIRKDLVGQKAIGTTLNNLSNISVDGQAVAVQQDIPGYTYARMTPASGIDIQEQGNKKYVLRLYYEAVTAAPTTSITYHANYEGADPDIVIQDGVVIDVLTKALGEDTFTRQNYLLTMWNEKPDGSGANWKPGMMMFPSEQTANLYAIWKPIAVGPFISVLMEHSYFVNDTTPEATSSDTLKLALDEGGSYYVANIASLLRSTNNGRTYSARYPITVTVTPIAPANALLAEAMADAPVADALIADSDAHSTSERVSVAPGASGVDMPESNTEDDVSDADVADTAVVTAPEVAALIAIVPEEYTVTLNAGDSFTFDDKHTYTVAMDYNRKTGGDGGGGDSGGDGGGGGGGGGTTTIPENNIPLGNLPGNLVTIIDPLLPLGNLPKSGSKARAIAIIGGLVIVGSLALGVQMGRRDED